MRVPNERKDRHSTVGKKSASPPASASMAVTESTDSTDETARSAEQALSPAPAEVRAESPTPPSGLSSDVWIDLEALDASTRFQLCPEGSVDALATSLVRQGQLFAIDVRPSPEAEGRFEIVCGFRRVAALRLLMRRRVLARVHRDLSDEDALSRSLLSIVEARRVDRPLLESLRDRLDAQQRLTPALAEILTHAISPEVLDLPPETVDGAEVLPPIVDPCVLVQRILDRLAPLNQDLSQLAQCWDALPREVREAVLQQLVYPSDMARYLKRLPLGLF
jgi:hypothetical protein